MRFVLAIFVHGDVETKKHALGVKNLITALFNGLDQDAYKVRGGRKYNIVCIFD